jgi:hypothetical protein
MDTGVQIKIDSNTTFEHFLLAGWTEGQLFDEFNKYRNGTLKRMKLEDGPNPYNNTP